MLEGSEKPITYEKAVEEANEAISLYMTHALFLDRYLNRLDESGKSLEEESALWFQNAFAQIGKILPILQMAQRNLEQVPQRDTGNVMDSIRNEILKELRDTLNMRIASLNDSLMLIEKICKQEDIDLQQDSPSQTP